MNVTMDSAMKMLHRLPLGNLVRRKRWNDLPWAARRGIGGVALVQMGLLGAAALDLARRPASQIPGGRKWPWMPVLLFNIIGPLAYFAIGRSYRRRGATEAADAMRRALKAAKKQSKKASREARAE